MRKADYNLLASIMGEQLSSVEKLSDPHARSIAESILRQIAYEFALQASVDQHAFLRACSMK
jgi:hypothetical protein